MIIVKKTITYSLLIVIFCSCTTTKSRNDQSKLAQFYHNLTSKFNGHFNANELVDEGIFILEEQYVDNYNELIPIHQYMAVDNADAVKSDMDEAIKKVSVVLKLHEYSDWADDCYLLIGKSEFIKQDYEAAENALEYYMDEFKPNGKRTTIRPKKKKKRPTSSRSKNPGASRKSGKKSAKATRASKQAAKERKRYNKQVKKAQNKRKKNNNSKKKKKKSDEGIKTTPTPDKNVPPKTDISAPKSTEKDGLEVKKAPEKEKLNGMLGHKPAYNAALLWLARTYIERENYIAADYNLIKLEKSNNLTDEVVRELPVIRAHYNIRRQNYAGAIERLENAIEIGNKRKLKARYAYIIAQLHELLNQGEKASESYDRVIAFNPDYEMEFNARLKKMTNGIASGIISNKEALTKLNRMVKDFKNTEYQDQIYFALAHVALSNNDIPLAIENLVLSVESPGKNPAQKTETNFLLAKLYYDQASYVNAKSAFDATLSTMKETDDRYDYTKLLSENLTDIAKNLEIIALKDSLIMIAQLSDEERATMAQNIKREKDKAASIAEANSLNSKGPIKGKSSGRSMATNGRQDLPSARNANFGAIESSFFAYDAKTVKRGEKDFKKTWGEIKLTDNWRMRSKVQGSFDEEAGEEAPVEILTDKDVDNIFKGVPSTPEEIEAAHGEIRKAMQALGTLYREKLEDYDASAEILERLLSTYPEAQERLQTYYELYLTYLGSGNSSKAEYYKNKIIKEFSTSKFAKALSDPDYAKNHLSEKQKLVKYYDETFALFSNGNMEGTQKRIEESAGLFGAVNPLSSKFALLNSMVTGKLSGRDPYIDALKKLIAAYPRTEEEKKARDILLLLGASTTGKTYGASGLNKAKFTLAPDKAHFVMVYIKNQKDIKMSEAKISISKYNREYHNLDKIRITSVTFNPETKESIILLRSFPNQEKAVEYSNGIFRKKAEFLMETVDFVAYPITQNNYREVIKERSVESYETFYKDNY